MNKVSRIVAREIQKCDCEFLTEFLAKGLGYSGKRFVEIFSILGRRPKIEGYPQYGLLIEAEGNIVGALLTVYSNIEHATPAYIRCHLTCWYVEPAYSIYGSLLAKAAINRPNVTYINISARPHTWKIIEAQGFRRYSQGQFLVLCALHLMDTPAGATIFEGLRPPTSACEIAEAKLIESHAKHGCLCLWGEQENKSYPFVLRPIKLKGIIPVAQVVYCRDMNSLRLFIGPLSRWLLRHGILLLSSDSNGQIADLRGIYFDGLRPRFYKGVRPALGDLAYTLDALVPFSRRL